MLESQYNQAKQNVLTEKLNKEADERWFQDDKNYQLLSIFFCNGSIIMQWTIFDVSSTKQSKNLEFLSCLLLNFTYKSIAPIRNKVVRTSALAMWKW